MKGELKFTHIDENKRYELGITRDEYALCNYIHTWSSNPLNERKGLCDRSVSEIAKFIGITERGCQKMIKRMKDKGLIEDSTISGKKYRATTENWFYSILADSGKTEGKNIDKTAQKDEKKEEKTCEDEGVNKVQGGVNKVRVGGEQSSGVGVNKVRGHLYNIYNSIYNKNKDEFFDFISNYDYDKMIEGLDSNELRLINAFDSESEKNKDALAAVFAVWKNKNKSNSFFDLKRLQTIAANDALVAVKILHGCLYHEKDSLDRLYAYQTESEYKGDFKRFTERFKKTDNIVGILKNLRLEVDSLDDIRPAVGAVWTECLSTRKVFENYTHFFNYFKKALVAHKHLIQKKVMKDDVKSSVLPKDFRLKTF